MIERFGSATPELAPDAYVHTTAVLIGQVTVGAESSIWPCAVLRGDHGRISVGARTSVQDGAVCHVTENVNSVSVGDQVTVGHRAILHGCRIEPNVIVGMGSIVMDDVVVGQWTIIGAGAVVTPGKVIPRGSVVVGNPARVVRPVNERDRSWITTSWKTYVDYARRFREAP
jgi:gamma-carbonic anhydrase